MDLKRDFHGVNSAYMQDLYDRYCKDPLSVDEATRSAFAQWTIDPEAPDPDYCIPVHKIVSAVNLAQSIRNHGHLAAQLDPLGTPPPGDPSLVPTYHNLTEDDMRLMPPTTVGGPVSMRATNMLGAIEEIRRIYCSSMGHDFEHIHIPKEREWLRYVVEEGSFRPPATPVKGELMLKRLTRVEVFEKFLHRVFPGKFRFSVEGLDMLVPMLEEIIRLVASLKISNILIGMAHRGRLNVLAHILRMPYRQILAEFRDPVQRHVVGVQNEMGWMGDVKYHGGTSLVLKDGEQVNLRIRMAPNPSHLEFVNPVVQGMARAVGTRVNKAGTPAFDHRVTLPIMIHGDAAFPGQGVVAETLNLSRLKGYETGGTIHIIANNQLGFTTNPENSRSTLFASDLAKGFEIPIIHINADDVEGCIEAARMAAAYLARFQKDFMIDLVGYRRWGHNEGDEAAFTQPLMYQKIPRHRTARELWAEKMVRRGEVSQAYPSIIEKKYNQELQDVLDSLEPEEDLKPSLPKTPPAGAARKVRTSVPRDRLLAINQSLKEITDGFDVHSKLNRILSKRRDQVDHPSENRIDWGAAEELAFATILEDGVAIRLTGQDVERGTFSHRHCVLYGADAGESLTPLHVLPQARAAFEVINSPLTECAVIGFEYGYNVQRPGRLVIWEAQYGDFVNSAQVMVDEFVSSARSKWGQRPSMVILLPHGHEGAGPDHSSGRLERFLSMGADINIRIAIPSTAAQYFHLLRRQAALLRMDPLPLVVLSPKSLLRHPMIASSMNELAGGRWKSLMHDNVANQDPGKVKRLVMCCGKMYYDMVAGDSFAARTELSIVRIEQMFPFPKNDIDELLGRYPNLEEVFWVQEEPRNMGAWTFLRPRIKYSIEGRWPLYYIGRPRQSSPAEGSSALHQINQKNIVDQVTRLLTNRAEPGIMTA
jgi:2-oxoglutarate dehydrogenase E1 component